MSEQPLTYDWVAGKPKAVPADKLPPKEYMKGNLHIVDLSKCVDPYTESRPLRVPLPSRLQLAQRC